MVDGVSCDGNDFALDDLKLYDYATLPYTANFNDGKDSKWQFNNSQHSSDSPDFGPYEGERHLVIEPKEDNQYGRADLHVDLANLSNDAILSFWCKQEEYYEDEEKDGIYMSTDNGQTFTKIFAFEHMVLSQWKRYELNLTQLAAANGLNASGFITIRFQNYNQNNNIYAHRFCIDAVEIVEDTFYQVPFNASIEQSNPINLWKTGLEDQYNRGIADMFLKMAK